jgi:guanine nucleotide-binding protein G(I)/G(S)/G(T) subunit beta-1
MASVHDRMAAVRAQIETLKEQIAAAKAAKEDAIDWVAYGRESDVNFSFNIRRQLRGHFGKVYALAWGGDGTTLLSASQDGKLIVWNAYTENKLDAISLKSAWVMTCDIEPEDQRHVAAGGLDNVCTVYDVRNPSLALVELVGHDGYLSDCTFLERRYMLTCSGDATAALWDLERGGVRSVSFVDHAADVMSIAPHPGDPNCFATGSCDGTVRVWDIRAGHSVRAFGGHMSDVNAVSWFPGGSAVGSGSDDASCRMFDVRSAGPVAVFAGAWAVAAAAAVPVGRACGGGGLGTSLPAAHPRPTAHPAHSHACSRSPPSLPRLCVRVQRTGSCAA